MSTNSDDGTIRVEAVESTESDSDDGGLSDGWAAPATVATFVLLPTLSFGLPAAYEYSRSGDLLRSAGAGVAGTVAVAVTGRTIDYFQNR